MCRMATRVREGVVRRPSVSLTAQDEADLAALKESAELPEILGRLVGLPIDPRSATESALLLALLRAGIHAVQDEVADLAYEQLAPNVNLEARQAVARRRRPTWADER